MNLIPAVYYPAFFSRPRVMLTAAAILVFTFTPAQAEPAGAPDNTRPVTVPLKPKGFRFAVEALINEQVKANLIIDTGSSFTVVSEEVALGLGYKDLDDAPRFPVSTAAGETWVRLVLFESVKIGLAEARYVEGAVSSNPGKGADGLLGLSFLNEFAYKIDGKKGLLTLKRSKGDGPLFGGYGREWWSSKFERYSQTIRRYESYLYRHANRLKAASPCANGNETRFTEQDIKKIIDYFRRLRRVLDRRATSLGVPEAWKASP